MGTSLASYTTERFAARRRELATAAGTASLGKDARVLMSPAYVDHVLRSYGPIIGCDPTIEDPDDFAPCMNGEMPADAVAVKSRWMPSSLSVPVYDTSAATLKTRLAGGTFGSGDGTGATPTPAQAYTMQLTPTTTSRLVALHIMTKELQDWAWITLWWSPDPNSDFGADRPATIDGVFANYKMCVVTAVRREGPDPRRRLPRHARLRDRRDPRRPPRPGARIRTWKRRTTRSRRPASAATRTAALAKRRTRS